MTKTIRHILFADDDADDQYLFSAALASINNQIKLSTYSDCDELMSELSRQPELPDIIFIDLNMPGNDHNRCLKLIKEDEQYAHIPTIIYSTSTHPGYIRDSIENGALRYVVKPSSLDGIKKVIQEIFDQIPGDPVEY